MTEIQNPKQLIFDFILDLDIVIWCLYIVIPGLSGDFYFRHPCRCPADIDGSLSTG
jgi:hypothetical protein